MNWYSESANAAISARRKRLKNADAVIDNDDDDDDDSNDEDDRVKDVIEGYEAWHNAHFKTETSASTIYYYNIVVKLVF